MFNIIFFFCLIFICDYTGKKKIGDGDYEGDLVAGKAHGRGVYTLANGNRYDGEFKDDKMNGRGVKTFANGSPKQAGQWKDGNFLG